MGSPLHNLSILQNQDFISVTDCADAVSDDNFCMSFIPEDDGTHYNSSWRSQSVIKDENRCLPCQSPGNRNPLLLTAG